MLNIFVSLFEKLLLSLHSISITSKLIFKHATVQ